MRLLRDAISLFMMQAPFFLAVAILVYLPINATLNLAFGNTESLDEIGAEFRVAGLADTFLGSFAVAFATVLAAKSKMGKQPGLAESFAQALRFWPAMIGATILSNIGITIGLVLLVIPGVYLFLRWAYVMPVIALEDCGVSESFRRSAQLTKGRRFEILGMFVIVLIGALTLSMAAYLPIEFLPEKWWLLATISADTVLDMIFLIWPVLMTLYYLESRSIELEPGEELLESPEYPLSEAEIAYQVDQQSDNPFRAPKI